MPAPSHRPALTQTWHLAHLQAELMRIQITHHLDRARVAARAGAIGDTTDVDGVLKGLKRALDRIYESRALELTVESSPGLKFQGEKQDFEEMVGNLLDNACKWAKSHVWVSAARCDGAGNFEVLVDDDGPGLTGPDRAKAVSEGSVSMRRSQDRDLGSPSSPTSPISIKGASSLSRHRKAACAPASTCPRPNPLKNHRLLSVFCDNSTQTMRPCPAQGWGCPFRTKVDGNNVFARGVRGDARFGADSGRGLRVVPRRRFPPRGIFEPRQPYSSRERPRPCLHAGNGAVIGGIGNSSIGRQMSTNERGIAADAEFRALEYGRSGAAVAWAYPALHHRGSIVPGRPYKRGDQYCRVYTHTINRGGSPEILKGVACREDNGTWRGVS